MRHTKELRKRLPKMSQADKVRVKAWVKAKLTRRWTRRGTTSNIPVRVMKTFWRRYIKSGQQYVD